MAPVAKYALIPVFVGFSLFGFYATLGVYAKSGAGAITREIASGVRTVYTGVGPIDRHLTVLVGFFAALLDDPGAGWDTSAFFVWVLGQAGAAWTVLLLEGLRAGNRGRLVSFAGTVGFLFQNLTYAFVVPLYLALHLLTSPAAKLRRGDGEGARRALFVYLWDLAVLPSAVSLALGAPSLLMSLPAPFGHSAANHYGWVAVWQLFPVWTVLLQWTAHRAGYFLLGSMVPRDGAGRPTTPGVGFSVAVAGVYQFALTLCVATHLPVLLVAVLPPPLRAALASAPPAKLVSLVAPVLEQVTFARTFAPWPLPAGPPSVSRNAYAPGDLAALALNFLQYDFYSGSVPFLLWAVYLHQTTVKNASFLGTLRKVGFWLVLGGPLAAVTALVWERDEVVKEGETPLVEAKKTK